jgi:cysteine desulfurase/selenocysteine lyase
MKNNFLETNKQFFPLVEGVSYLDTAAEGIPPLTSKQALMSYWQEKSRGTPGRVRLFEVQKETEQAVGTLLGTSADNIVLLANASEALNLFANSIRWQAGDEVLISDLEFPSNVVVWLRLKELGVRLIVIPTQGGIMRLEDWTCHLSSRTKVVSVSQVSYMSGTQIPFMQALAEEAHRAGALFCVDATQALGRVPVSVRGVDYLVASSYKWILGSHGLGMVYLAPEMRETLRPGTAGWYSIDSVFHPQRFESFRPKDCAGQLQSGMPNFPGLFALKAGIDFLLSIGVDRLDRELRPLVKELRDGLEEHGLDLLTPSAPEFASGIVSFRCSEADSVAEKLVNEGVIVWGGDGRIRVSVHLYNDHDDIARCLSAVDKLKQSGQRGNIENSWLRVKRVPSARGK